MIAIVDYGLGNPGSIRNMLRHIGTDSEITSDHEFIRSASKLILPGVGSFDQGMQNLEAYGLTSLLNQRVLEDKTPVLGICLGMQLMTRGSEEGSRKGLGWLDAWTVRFTPPSSGERFLVPHMGWEYVTATNPSGLTNRLTDDTKFYFAHSYYVRCMNREEVILTTNGTHVCDAAFQKGNILGVQFHPEKSHRYGMQLLSDFIQNF